MKKSWLWAIVPGILTLMAGVFIVVLFPVKLLWAWTIPDLSPGAVAQGLIAGTISLHTALKVAIFIAVMAGLASVRRGKQS